MIISHSKRFIFVHNYKVAGTSVRSILNPHGNWSFRASTHLDKIKILMGIYPKVYSNQFYGHSTLLDLKKRIPGRIFSSYFKFGFVRDPWDWQVSLYMFMLQQKDHPQHKIVSSMKSFDEYIEWRVNKDLKLQKAFFYDEEGACLADFLGRYESLRSDFKVVREKMGIKSDLPHLNASRKERTYLNYYSISSIDMVYEGFKDDIETFNYSKPTLKSSQN